MAPSPLSLLAQGLGTASIESEENMSKSYLYEYRIRRVRRSMAKCPTASPIGREIHASVHAAAVFRHLMRESPTEEFYVLFLDVRNVVIGFELIARGTLTGVEVHPREVFRGAILASAAAIVVGHNHPSGDILPSPEDGALTARLQEAGELLEIPVLDHLVVAGDTSAHYSFSAAAAH